MKPLRGDRNQCSICNQYFNSTGAFNKHRIFSDPKKHDWSTRRCMTPDEMLSSGMSTNQAGFWVTSKMPEHRYIRTEGNEDHNKGSQRHASDGKELAG